MIVYVAFYDKHIFLGHYWMDHRKEDERKCLRHRCMIAFQEGISVFTAPVKEIGEVPTY